MEQLLEQGVKIKSLLESEVFSLELDFDEWPTTHSCDDEEIRPYNFSLFEIRKHYRSIFQEERFEPVDMSNDDED